MPTEAKRATVAELREELANARTMIVSEYRGLSVKEIAEIRRALRKQDVRYRVDAAKRKARERDDLSVILIEPGEGGVDTVWVESALEKRFVMDPAAGEFFRVRYF